MKQITVAEAHSRLSRWLAELKDGPITITRHGEPVGVLIDPDEYERLWRVQGYLRMTHLSQVLAERDVTAAEIFAASREELDARS